MPAILATPPDKHSPPSKKPPPFPSRRAEPPRALTHTPGVLKARAERAVYLHERETKEGRSMLRGLLLLALLALAISLFRAGADRAFFPGWWTQW